LKVTKTYVRLMAVDVAKTAGFYRRALGLVPPRAADREGNRFWLAQVSRS